MAKMRNVSIAIAGVACVAIGSAVAPSAAQAAIITNNFRVDITTKGYLENQSFFGNFTYDDASLTNPATQIIDPINGNQLINPTNGLLSLTFNFLGNTYTQQDDSGFPDYPQLNFKGGSFQGLDYLVSKFYTPSLNIPSPTDSFAISYNSQLGPFFEAYGAGDPLVNPNTPLAPTLAVGKVTYGVQAVPTPALLPGLIGLGVSVLRKRRTEAKGQAVES